MKNLTSLQLQQNQFYGKIPSSIGKLTDLENLDLSNNLFYNEIPLLLINCKKLINLNLSFNNLSGTIPYKLGMLEQLQNLNLSNNNFSGCLSNEFLVWCAPKIIDGVEVPRNINLANNILLPWQGDFEMFCKNPQNQHGAPCLNCTATDGFDVIQQDCSCGTIRNEPITSTGHVYIDYNSNGSFGSSDIAFPGVPVELKIGWPGWAIFAKTKTDANGKYSFYNIPPGYYAVHIPEGVPGVPSGSSNPRVCYLQVDSCTTTSVLECDFGYPPPDCTSNPYSVDNLCEMAYSNPLCDVSVIGEWACGQNPSEVGPWVGKKHCGGTYENTTFYGFVAGSGAYQFQFTIFSCAGTGVEYGLMEACNPDGPFVVCNASSNTGTVTIDASQLEPCKPYIFWIDGFQGSICSYYVEVQGDVKPCYISPIQDIVINQECNLLCPNLGTLPVTIVGTQGDLNIDDIDNLTLQWDISFNGGPYIKTTSTPSTDGVTIDVPFLQAGTYKICVETEYYCTKNLFPFCKTFEFQSPNITSKEYNLCIDDFPWNGEV
ncbi:MAG TPA: SdrD B-like domain-containing protein, partial [Saprospiraceae bacterium]|nr:SdrD B-like domain-containing protein [Saprospiraceae bacterium]